MPPGPPSSITLLGTGLIGASLGLALRRRHPDLEVVGTDANASHAEAALALGALTRTAASGPEAVADADLVVVAAPLDAIPAILSVIAGSLKPGALVTDVGSVKGSVMREAEALPEAVRFVGGHPMAGAAVGGPGGADALMFENAAYVLTPPRGIRDLAAYAPEALWLVEAVGARPVIMDADRHDVVAATVSHLPQLLAVALVAEAAEAGPDALGLAAGGFRDMTRIAGSPFSMWGPILHDNAEAVTGVLDRFAGRLGALRDTVQRDPEAIGALFEASGRTRADLPTSSKGFLAPLADVVVWAEDRPGFLHALTGAIAEAGLNLKDAELLRLREGETGTFRFGFASAPEADQAVEALTESGFRAARR